MRSYWYHDSLYVSWSPTFYFVVTGRPGGVSFRLLAGQRHLARPWSAHSYRYADGGVAAMFHITWPSYKYFEGADHSRGPRPIPVISRTAELPYWMIVPTAAVLPAAHLIRRIRRSSWRRHGLCRRCGYDLAGNESGACPECGTPVAAAVVEDT